MRLKYLLVRGFRNLTNTEIKIDESQHLLLFAGKNGSGKSNILSVILAIIRFARAEIERVDFTFKVIFQINGSDHCIEHDGKGWKYNDRPIGRIPSEAIPDKVVYYYAGHNKVINTIIRESEASYREKIKDLPEDRTRWLLGLSIESREAALLYLLLQDHGSDLRKVACDQLGVEPNEMAAEIIIKAPYYFKGRQESWEENIFWGTKGYIREYLDLLATFRTPEKSVSIPGFSVPDQNYRFVISLIDLRSFFDRTEGFGFFKFFDDLRILGMIERVKVPIRLVGSNNIDLNEMSDGEVQTCFITCCVDMFNKRECLFLLDEPDSFLHPDWQRKLGLYLAQLPSAVHGGNHILMTTHQAATVVQAKRESLQLVEKMKNRTICHSSSKEHLVRELTSGLIVLNRDVEILSILDEIQHQNAPILFTEGYTDVKILKTAWSRLYKSNMPFVVMHAFCCTFLSQLLSNEKVLRERRGHHMFGVFDFDEAYDSWNGLRGDVIQDDPSLGLCKRLCDEKVHAFLLPVPPHPDIERQVFIDKSKKLHHGGNSKAQIEHYFYGEPQTTKHFALEPAPGGGNFVVFRGNKADFAESVVPTCSDVPFKQFSGLFSSILQKAGLEATAISVGN